VRIISKKKSKICRYQYALKEKKVSSSIGLDQARKYLEVKMIATMKKKNEWKAIMRVCKAALRGLDFIQIFLECEGGTLHFFKVFPLF
jgi:hypothetical protein